MLEERGASAIRFEGDRMSTIISVLSSSSDDRCESNENEAFSDLEEEVV